MSSLEFLRGQGVKFNFHPDVSRTVHHVSATKNDEIIGSLSWRRSTGEVHVLDVHPEHRRQGVATALWDQAHSVAKETRGVKPPRHSADRTDKGELWARSVSSRLPRRLAAQSPPR